MQRASQRVHFDFFPVKRRLKTQNNSTTSITEMYGVRPTGMWPKGLEETRRVECKRSKNLKVFENGVYNPLPQKLEDCNEECLLGVDRERSKDLQTE